MARVVVVTGATRGIGRGIADAFARRGDTLVIAARSTDASPNQLGLPGTLEGVAALNLNLLAPVVLIQGFLPGMLQRGDGRVINITSSAARTHELPTGGVPQLGYGASKAGLDSLTYGLARDFAGMGVSFNLLAPLVFTESVEYHLTDDRFADLEQRMAAMGPYGEAVAHVADQPVEFTAQYLENDDLVRLGFLTEAP
jgi:NAD(P)-dependent dehydrogenase (short-subunit alcohol dehydrogenase family)